MSWPAYAQQTGLIAPHVPAQDVPHPKVLPYTAFAATSRGKDIGSQLLKHVVEGSSDDLYLTTLRRTIPFYEAAGFKLLQASEVPW